MSEQPKPSEMHKEHAEPKKAPETPPAAEQPHLSAAELEAKKVKESEHAAEKIQEVKGKINATAEEAKKEEQKKEETKHASAGHAAAEPGHGEEHHGRWAKFKHGTHEVVHVIGHQIGHAVVAPFHWFEHAWVGAEEWLNHYLESRKKKMTLTSIAKDIGNWFASAFKWGGGGGGGGGHH